MIRNVSAALLAAAGLALGASSSDADHRLCQSKSSSWAEKIVCRGGVITAQGITDQETGEQKVAMVVTEGATGDDAVAAGLNASGSIVCSTGVIPVPGNQGKSFFSGGCPGGRTVVLQHSY
jgi:hypothetical protein